MRAKIEISEDGGMSVIDSFWYQGASSGRAISQEIYKRFHASSIAQFRAVTKGGARIGAWCKIDAAEHSNAVDKCPSCGGSGHEVLAFLHGKKCIDCDGTGICH